MNVEEKERLIKKDIRSIENKVRSAFNQGYEMGVKELKAYKEQGGDAISREEAINAIYDLCGENVSLKENPWRDNPHMDAVVDALENLPSVTPQQRTWRRIGMTKEERIQSLKEIQENCKRRHMCNGCEYYTDATSCGCILRNIPSRWLL